MKPNLYLYALHFPDGTIYLGITRDVPTRWRHHRKFAARQKSQTRISIAIRKHGAGSVRVKTLAYGSYDYICGCEVRAISAFRSMELEFGHNTNPGGNAMAPDVVEKIRTANKNPSSETLAKMSAASSSRSPETIEKLRASHRGKKASVETRIKMSAARLGRFPGPETRAKLSAWQKGRKPSDAAIAKVTKLTQAQVLEIRQSTEPQRVLAKRHGVGQSQIHRIRTGQSWKHLSGVPL